MTYFLSIGYCIIRIYFTAIHSKGSVKIVHSSSVHDSIAIHLPSQQHDSQQHDSQQHDSPTDSSIPQNNPPSPKKKVQYINVPDCPVPAATRHSNVPVEDCPAYKKRSKTCINHSNVDYDDVPSTNVKMQRNPAYRHNTFTYV